MFRQVITDVQKSIDLQPLQYLAGMRVTILVCEAEDMQDLLRTFHRPGLNVAFSYEQCRRLRCKARKKLLQIGVPNQIIDIVLENLWTISFEVFKWMNYHAEDTDIDCSSAFCWTPRFAIDYVKTAEMLIKNEKLDTKKRFKLACIYCLEADLRSLWRRMSLSERRFFFVRGNLKETSKNLIVLYWTYYIQELPIDYWACEALKHKKLFKYSVEKGYLKATEYFFKKLNVQVRNKKISKCFSIYMPIILKYIIKDQLAIACFLICHRGSSNEYLPRIDLIFRYFLEWPWQKHFMTVVDQLRRHITDYTFGELLRAIFEKEMNGFKDHDYKELFMEFWLQGPESFKTYVNTEREIGYDMLMRFILKHFGFVFEEQSFRSKRKFRDMVLEQNGSENVQNFDPKNVAFFRFLIRAQVATRATIQTYSTRHWLRYQAMSTLPLGELFYLVDGLIGNV